jgi:WD40 repeat protein
MDGIVKLWDFIKGEEYYQKKFEGKGTAIDWMPRNELNLGRVVATGYENGIIRVLALNDSNFDILSSCKAHDSKIVKLKFAPDASMLVTASSDG